VLVWTDVCAGTAAAVLERLAVVSSVVVTVVAVAADVVVPDVDVDAVAVLPAAAMQPVSTSMPATLTEPASVRARRAGCGCFRRDPVVVIVAP
jgi:hypothetical protein